MTYNFSLMMFYESLHRSALQYEDDFINLVNDQELVILDN